MESFVSIGFPSGGLGSGEGFGVTHEWTPVKRKREFLCASVKQALHFLPGCDSFQVAWSVQGRITDMESLHLFAGIHSQHFDYHRLLAKRFPFAIYYRVQGEVVRIYAILDCRRDPVWLRSRLA